MNCKKISFRRLWAISFTLLVLSLPGAFAQNKITVKGIVTDELGEPMIGAGVLVKNTVTGVITGLDGVAVTQEQLA